MPVQNNEPGIYDPVNNVTHFYDEGGKYVGAEPGDVSNGEARNPGDLSNYTANPGSNTSKTDWGKYIKDNIADLIPAAVTMATPEFKSMGVIGNLLSRFGLSTGVGSAADMLMNAGNDKTKTQSTVDAGTNALLQMLPDAMNVGFNPQGITRTSTTMREPTKTSGSSETIRSNSGSSTTKSSSSTLSGPEIATILKYVPGLKGQFGKNQPFPEPTGNYQSAAQSSSTTQGGGQGVSNTTREGMSMPGLSTTQREVGLPGLLGHALDVLKSLQTYNANRLTPMQRAMVGLGLNVGRDASDRPTQ